MNEFDAAKKAGDVLRKLIEENYSTQQEFADDYGLEIRTVCRYLNDGISKVPILQSLAEFFEISIKDFFPD